MQTLMVYLNCSPISVVGGGIAPESGSLTEYGMTATDHITLEETSQPFYKDTYEGTKIVLETGTFQTSVLQVKLVRLQM